MKFLKGKVQWFNSKLGYGFINSRGINKDIYVHYKDIKSDGYKNLYKNEIVEFIYDEEKNKALEVNVIRKAPYMRKNKKSIDI